MPDAPAMNELLGADTPMNWGKWGPDDELGSRCAEDRRWSFRYAATQLKVVGAAGAPVNPMAIR